MNSLVATQAKYLAERRQVLETFDLIPWSEARPRVAEFFERHNTAIPANDRAFLATVHKSRVYANEMSDEARQRSSEWLILYGYRVMEQ